MSAKFSAQRKRAFLDYLSQSGNQTLSAERAKVSRSWVQLHRASDAGFDAACREAIEEARERLSAPSPRPSSSRGDGDAWRYHDGHELVVESVVAGTGGSGGGKRVQVRRARVKQWTPRVEKRFLSVLAATCNVRRACAEVGMWPPSAYNHRKRWPAFAEAWDEAIETGYVRLEAALVEQACNPFSTLDDVPIVEMPPMTADQKIQLLHMHKHQVRGLGKRPGLPERVATPEEAEAAFAKALRQLESWMEREGAKNIPQEF